MTGRPRSDAPERPLEGALRALRIVVAVSPCLDKLVDSEQRGDPATVLAREAIEEWIRRQRREELAKAIRAYAEEVAGSDEDLDDGLAEAAEMEAMSHGLMAALDISRAP